MNINDIFNHQSIVLLLSILYIYMLSDLYTVINEGPNFKLVTRLCVPIWGKIVLLGVNRLSKYNIDLYEWWHRTVSPYLIIAYSFRFIRWIYDHSIHICWDSTMEYALYLYFSSMVAKILYNYYYIYFSFTYLFFSLLCTYGVYMKFNTSKSALVTITSKCIEMGAGIIVSEQLHIIEEWKDYCIKYKNTWLAYVIKLVIGYYSFIDIDSDVMAREMADYVGASYDECVILYKKSVVKKVSSVLEISKSMYSKILYPFSSHTEIIDDKSITNETISDNNKDNTDNKNDKDDNNDNNNNNNNNNNNKDNKDNTDNKDIEDYQNDINKINNVDNINIINKDCANNNISK